jgi:MFS family permease
MRRIEAVPARASGLGWALGIGRLGGIAGPALGGYLLALGLRPPTIFLSACGFMLVAAVAAAVSRQARPQPRCDASRPVKASVFDQLAYDAFYLEPRTGLGSKRVSRAQ